MNHLSSPIQCTPSPSHLWNQHGMTSSCRFNWEPTLLALFTKQKLECATLLLAIYWRSAFVNLTNYFPFIAIAMNGKLKSKNNNTNWESLRLKNLTYNILFHKLIYKTIKVLHSLVYIVDSFYEISFWHIQLHKVFCPTYKNSPLEFASRMDGRTERLHSF